MGGLTAKAMIGRKPCSAAPVPVDVAVSSDIAPAIKTIARSFDSRNLVVHGHCVTIRVTGGDTALQADQIDGQAPRHGQAAPAAWIPDSSLWVDVARTYPEGAQAIQAAGRSVARSPLLLVTTTAVAARTHLFAVPPAWTTLLPPADGGPPSRLGLSVELPDPADSAAGMTTLIEISRVLGDNAAARTAITRFVLGAQPTEDFDSAAGLRQFVQSTLPPFSRQAVTVASEQAVLAYDKVTPNAPLDARYPTGSAASLGSPELDYPYVLTTSKAVPRQAATEFGDYLHSSYARAAVRYYGFRDAAGAPGPIPLFTGLASQPLQLASAPSASEVAANLQVWQKLGLGSRDLTLIDVSPAMSHPDGNGTQTLEQALTQTAARGLALFPDSTQMGLWEIGSSSSLSHPYHQLVPVGPLPASYGLLTRRTQLQQIIARLRPGSGALALHDAIWAAYQHMTATYASNYANAVLVLTSGVDSARGDMPLASLLRKLRALYNPGKKVEIVILMIGRSGSFTAMQEVADATGGVAYQITNPAQVGKIFVEALAHRMCDQGCAAP